MVLLLITYGQYTDCNGPSKWDQTSALRNQFNIEVRCQASNAVNEQPEQSERFSCSGRHDLKRLKDAMLSLIVYDAPLDPEWLDHPLKGGWAEQLLRFILSAGDNVGSARLSILRRFTMDGQTVIYG